MPHLRPFLPCILKKLPGIWKLRPAYSNFIKIIDFTVCMTFKFNGWPHKTIGHLFYPMSSFVHHFIAISELKLELQSGNAKFGSKSVIFLSRVTLKFDGWSWKAIRHLFYAALCFVHNFIAIGEFNLELQSGNAQFGSKLKVFCKVKGKVTVLSPHPGSELCSADFDKYLPWSLGLLLSISVWITISTPWGVYCHSHATWRHGLQICPHRYPFPPG